MVLVCLNKTSDTQAAVLKAGAFAVNILAEGQQDLAYRFARKGDKFGRPRPRRRPPRRAGAARHAGAPGVRGRGDGHRRHAHGLPRPCRRRRRARRHAADLLPRPVRPAGERPRGGGLPGRPRVRAGPALRAERAARTGGGGREAEHRAHPRHLRPRATGRRPRRQPHRGEPVRAHTAHRRGRGPALLRPLHRRAGGRRRHASATSRTPTSRCSTATPPGSRTSSPTTRRRSRSSSTPATATTATSSAWAAARSSATPTSGWASPRCGGEAIAAHDWRRKFDITHHAELTRACRDGDTTRARQLIIEHTEQVRQLVRDVIDRAGGAL